LFGNRPRRRAALQMIYNGAPVMRIERRGQLNHRLTADRRNFGIKHLVAVEALALSVRGRMSDDMKSKKRLVRGPYRVSLSAPWGPQQTINRTSRCDFDATTEVDEFIRERTRLHEIYLREAAKTKRLGLLLGFLLIVIAAVIIQFAPAGRERLSYWIGGALVIFAAGSCGFGRVWGRASAISFGAGQDRRSVDSHE